MFLAIEGGDGVGKATQAALLKKKFEEDGKKVILLSFPMYDQPSSDLVKHYLNGAFGTDPMKINAYTTALLFAADRGLTAPQWKPAVLDPQNSVIADRYVGSNALYQAAKLQTYCDKIDFFSWLVDLEFHKLELPRPDLTVFLNSSVETAASRRKDRPLKNGEKNDIHEENLPIQQLSHNTGLMAAKYYGWTVINADRPPEAISDEIYTLMGGISK